MGSTRGMQPRALAELRRLWTASERTSRPALSEGILALAHGVLAAAGGRNEAVGWVAEKEAAGPTRSPRAAPEAAIWRTRGRRLSTTGAVSCRRSVRYS